MMLQLAAHDCNSAERQNTEVQVFQSFTNYSITNIQNKRKFEINIKKPVTEQRMLKDLVYVSAINDLVFFVHPHFLTKSECQIAQLSA